MTTMTSMMDEAAGYEVKADRYEADGDMPMSRNYALSAGWAYEKAAVAAWTLKMAAERYRLAERAYRRGERFARADVMALRAQECERFQEAC